MSDNVKVTTTDERIDSLRVAIKKIAEDVLSNKNFLEECETNGNENRPEELANLMLCYRHLEDASMRLGKVKQHLNGGVSIYDKNVVGSQE